MFDPNAANSRIDAETVSRWLASNPCRPVLDKAGNPTGEYITCPVRMSFPNVTKKGKPIEEGKEPRHSLTLLFPHGADLSVLKKAATDAVLAKWPNPPASLTSPFRDQGEKKHLDGYVEGAIFMTASGDRKPYFVDQRMAPMTDDSKEYPGAWAIVTLRPFVYDKGVKKGVSFGLQGVMFVADDTQLGGGGSDPNTAFAGVQIEQSVNPAGLFENSGPAAGGDASIFD